MEFARICFHGCYQCYSVCPFKADDAILFIQGALLLGSPAALYWFIRIVYRWNIPWFEGRDVTRIEFPLPPMVSQIVELIPVAMMVGNCGAAKRCAYCHEELNNDSARRFCPACRSVAHEECDEINEGCSVFGCLKRKEK